jgi:hypothetical protein
MLDRPQTFGGMKITVSNEAYKMVPIFPDKPRTKRRMRRTRGKFGRLDRMNPLAYHTSFGLVIHPKLYDALNRQPKPPTSNRDQPRKD